MIQNPLFAGACIFFFLSWVRTFLDALDQNYGNFNYMLSMHCSHARIY